MPHTAVNLEVTRRMICNTGQSLKDVSDQQPCLVVFLRHFGCVFCKEALSDLAQLRSFFDQNGIKIVFVHMAPVKTAENYFQRYGLGGTWHVSNPQKTFYAAFGLMKGSISQLYGLRTWIRGYSARKEGHQLELAEELGDSTQMPGIFLIQQGEILNTYIHRHASDRPDYQQIVSCCTPRQATG
ncbi:MAG: SelL-related redox protein [Bacteroidota bacterium]